MITFTEGEYPETYDWKTVIKFIHTVYPDYNGWWSSYSEDMEVFRDVCEKSNFSVEIELNGVGSFTLHFKDQHHEMLFKLKYL